METPHRIVLLESDSYRPIGLNSCDEIKIGEKEQPANDGDKTFLEHLKHFD